MAKIFEAIISFDVYCSPFLPEYIRFQEIRLINILKTVFNYHLDTPRYILQTHFIDRKNVHTVNTSRTEINEFELGR